MGLVVWMLSETRMCHPLFIGTVSQRIRSVRVVATRPAPFSGVQCLVTGPVCQEKYTGVVGYVRPCARTSSEVSRADNACICSLACVWAGFRAAHKTKMQGATARNPQHADCTMESAARNDTAVRPSGPCST